MGNSHVAVSGIIGKTHSPTTTQFPVATILGLAPIFLHPGRGSDVMQPMAIPSIGGMSVALITLFVILCCYCLVKEWQFRWRGRSLPESQPMSGQ